jgi:phosphotransferase system HPr (HPr) family protein
MIVTQLTVTHKVGLHARPAALFVQAAKKFSSKITVCNLTTRGAPVDAKSIISVLTLGVMQDHEIEITADGVDEQNAIQGLTELVASNFTVSTQGEVK